MANKRREKAEKAKVYRMPDAYEDDEGKLLKDKRMAALSKRYDDEEEKKKTTEQEEWEKFKLEQAINKFGAKKPSKEEKNYELLLDNPVDFIQSVTVAGIVEEKKKE